MSRLLISGELPRDGLLSRGDLLEPSFELAPKDRENAGFDDGATVELTVQCARTSASGAITLVAERSEDISEIPAGLDLGLDVF